MPISLVAKLVQQGVQAIQCRDSSTVKYPISAECI